MHIKQHFILIYLTSAFFAIIICEDKKDIKSYNELYEDGVQFYLDNNFSGCIEKLKQAIEQYRVFTTNLQNCRLECTKEASQSKLLHPRNVNDLQFFEKTIRYTLCFIKCRNKYPELSEFSDFPVEVDKEFQRKKPYEYLQLCYFQEKQYQNAASAAFTYLVSNPNSTVMRKSLEHYLTFPEVDKTEVVNFEAKEYFYLYSHGSAAYEKKDWKSAINYMEETVTSYLQSEDECRALCEGSYEHGRWYSDFIPSIANHFTVVLKCKRKCRDQLSSLYGEKHEYLLPTCYDYLQFSYFKEKNYQAACEAVASYLLFYPDDDKMRSNMKYYLQIQGIEDYFFTPREEAVSYIERQTYEDKILKFIKEEFYL